MVAIWWKKDVLLTYRLCCGTLDVVLGACVSFPFVVLDRAWNSVVLVPEYCLFIEFVLFVSLCCSLLHDISTLYLVLLLYFISPVTSIVKTKNSNI